MEPRPAPEGQVGSGTASQKEPTPVSVQGASESIRKVRGGGSHTCGLLSSGLLTCWGSNFDGQLGDGSFNPSPTPQTVDSAREFGQFDLGENHTCAQSANDNEIYCWGLDSAGQLGNGSSSNAATNTPDPVLCP